MAQFLPPQVPATCVPAHIDTNTHNHEKKSLVKKKAYGWGGHSL